MRTGQANNRGNTNAASMFERLEDRKLMSAAIAAVAAMPQMTVSHALEMSAQKAPPRVSAVVSTAGTGLSGEYFTDSNFQSAYLVRTDTIVKLLGNAKRDPSAQQAQSIRWTGQVSPTYTEAYSFSIVANGGVQLWVDGQMLINQPQSKGGNFPSTSQISLVAGQKYNVEVEFTRHSTAAPKVQFLWASHHQKQGLIPQQAMFPDTSVSLPAVSGGLIGQYYLGKNFQQLVMQRIDPTINFSFAAKSPSFLIPQGSSFSVKWTGQITPKYSETYTFTTLSDDGVRLYVNDALLINDFTDHSVKADSAQITLVAGQAYDIRMDYYENFGVATAKLLWSSPSQAQEIVPASAFTSTPPATAGTLTATVTGDSTIHLAWTGSAAATGYNVEESIDGGATYQIVKNTAAFVTECDVVDLDPDTSYLFRIVPLGSLDTSITSNPVSTQTAPLTPGGLSSTPVSPTSITLNWQDVTGEAGFIVYQASSADPTDFDQIAQVPPGVTTFTASGLSAGQSYLYEISSVDSSGTQSAPTTPVSGSTFTDAPGSISSEPAGPNSVVLNWAQVPGENGFAVDRSLAGTDEWQQIATTLAGVTTYTDTAVFPGTSYDYRVRSLSAAGSSDPSSPLSVVSAVNAPAGLVPSLTTAVGTVLNWNDVAGENGFDILESTDGGQTFSQVGITPAGVTTLALNGLTAGSGYQFAIEALNSAGVPSTASPTAAVLTLPNAPAGLNTTPLSTTAATLAWSDVAGETGFIIQRSPDGVTGWSTIATLPTGTLSYADTSLAPGTNYFYRISALNSTGTSDPTAVVTALTIPAAPVASLTGLSTSQSQVSWAAVSGVSQYIVERSLNGTTNWSTAATVSGSSLSAAVANLAASTMFYYRVTAVNPSGSSTASPAVGQTSAPLAQYVAHGVVYGTTTSGGIYAVDLTNGTSTWIGQLPVIPLGAVRDPLLGIMYFYKQGTSNIYVWDPTTGNTTFVDTSFIPVPTVAGAYEPNGASFIVGNNNTLFQGASGSLSVTTIGTLKLAGVALTTTPTSMTISPTGQVYMTDGSTLYTVNTTTAAVTPIVTGLLGNSLAVFGPKGILYMTSSTGGLYSLNLTTLVQTLLGNDNLPSFTSLAADAIFTHLSVTASASPTTFTKGQNATYTVQVSNTAGDGTTQPITVTTTLPTGLTYVSITGTGWTASTSGQTVTLTYTGNLAANGTLPALGLTVAVSASAPAAVTTQFTVTGSDLDANPLPTPATVISLVT